MAFVVTNACVGCRHTRCVEVCPVDCFHDAQAFLVINPDGCIDCQACEPACPEKAIFPANYLPPGAEHFIEANATLARLLPVISKGDSVGSRTSPEGIVVPACFQRPAKRSATTVRDAPTAVSPQTRKATASTASRDAATNIARIGRTRKLIDLESFEVFDSIEAWGQYVPRWPEAPEKSLKAFWKSVPSVKVQRKSGLARAKHFDPDSNRGYRWELVYLSDSGRTFGRIIADSTGDETDNIWDNQPTFEVAIKTVRDWAKEAQAEVDAAM